MYFSRPFAIQRLSIDRADLVLEAVYGDRFYFWSVSQMGYRNCVYWNDRAAIAQLGERQTEDLKVPGSIPGLGTFSCRRRCHERTAKSRERAARWEGLAQIAFRTNCCSLGTPDQC